jgi:hypothetical protein
MFRVHKIHAKYRDFLLSHCCTKPQITPRRSLLPEKLIVTQLVKKFPAFYENQ